MIISDEQVRRSLAYLQNTEEPSEAYDEAEPVIRLPEELLARVSERLRLLPETRPDRVEAAKQALAEQVHTSEEVAHKMIGRIISDAIR